MPAPAPLPSTPSPARRQTLRAIALFEAVKGLVALGAALGLLSLLHRDLHRLALAMLWRFHLEPDHRLPALLLHYADLLAGIDLRTLAPLAVGYVALRWAEAWGLWKDKAWAELLGVVSGALYVPLEVGHLLHRPTPINAGVLLANLLIVAFLALQLWKRRRLRAVGPAGGGSALRLRTADE
jgi:uncharacterized membrane protein (DUF2068 family)